MSDGAPAWKICENRFVRGLATIFSAIGVPILLALFFWLASSFVDMRDKVLLTVSKMPKIETTQEKHEERIRHLEIYIGDRRPWGDR